MKELIYFPKQLADELEKINKTFSGNRRLLVKPDGELDDLLKQLIYTLVALKPSFVSRFGRERTEEEISALARYVCTNTLRVNCANIFAILDEYASSKDWKMVFGDWQNHYNNQEIVTFLKNGYENNTQFQQYLSSKGIEKTGLFWIDKKDKVYEICNKCKNADTIEEYSERLTKTGLIEDTLLMKSCLAKFFLNCSAKAYRHTDEKDIYDAFIKLSLEEKTNLIVNFVRVLELPDLQHYSDMFKAFEILRKEKKELFNDRLQKANLVDKYNKWRNRMEIIWFFNNEDPYRTSFWLQYVDGAKEIQRMYFRNRTDKILIMNFGDYVVTEFVEKAGGKMYIFPSELFIAYKLHIKDQTISNFKSEANSDWNVKEEEHRPPYDGWYSKFSYVLMKHGIKPSGT